MASPATLDVANRAVLGRKLAIWIVYINVALYATCFQLQRPVEPFLIDRLSKTGSMDDYARLQSFFSLLQMVGSIIVGRFLDRLGARTMFLVTFLASALSYFLLSKATTMDILYYSKLPTILQAGFLCAQTLVAQITSDGEERVTTMGRLTVAYTVGMVIGPAMGGFLGAGGDYYFGASLACYGSLLSCALTMMLPASTNELTAERVGNKKLSNSDLPSAAPAANGAATSTTTSSSSSSSQGTSSITSQFEDMRAIFFSVGGLLGTKVVSSVANSMRETTLPLVLKNVFGMREQSLGSTLSGLSALNAVVNGFLLGPVSRFFGGDLLPVIHHSLLGLVSLCLAQSLLMSGLGSSSSSSSSSSTSSSTTGAGTSPVPSPAAAAPWSLHAYLATTFFMSICAYILSTNATSESTSRVSRGFRGTLLGLEHSLFAAARIGAPAAGVQLLKTHGVSGVGLTASAVFGSILLAWHGVQWLNLGFGGKVKLGAARDGWQPAEERKER